MNMTKKWTLTIVGFLAAGALLSILVVAQLLFYGSRRGTYEWVQWAYGGAARQYNSQLFALLEDDADMVQRDPRVRPLLLERRWEHLEAFLTDSWSPREPNGFWVAVAPDGGFVTNRADCRGTRDLGGRLQGHQRGFVLCGAVPAMLATSSRTADGEPRLFMGFALDETYLDGLRAFTNTELALLGPGGYGASTVKNQAGRRLPLGLPEDAVRDIVEDPRPHFGVYTLRIPSYQGFELSTGVLHSGHSSMESYVYAGSVDIEHGALPVDLVFAVPRSVMDMGATYSLIAMAGTSAMIVIGLGLLAWRLTRRFTRPLTELAHAAKRIGDGERDVAVAIDGELEVRQVAIAFNQMVKNLDEAQARTLQSAKMAAIGELAAGVAHEINNPLAVILGFAQGLDRRVEQESSLRLPVTSIVRESLRCKALVQELLTFSRTGKKAVEQINLNFLLRGTAQLLESRARTQDTKLSLDLGGDIPSVPVNASQLQQVIVNLGNNALDAVENGGELVLRSRHSGNGEVYLEIQDTGTGIPDEIRARMFDPFFTTKEVGKGTGLGLSLSYDIVRQHGGAIDVDSELGKGTTMRVRLPLETRTDPVEAKTA